MPDRPLENWGAADAYERYVGRWSRPVARAFLAGLRVPAGGTWADIGCGTGALTAAILEGCAPASVTGLDRAEGFVEAARRQLTDARASFEVADAARLPLASGSCDAAVSGLALNFVADPAQMLREMVRVTKPGGSVPGGPIPDGPIPGSTIPGGPVPGGMVAAYVWDYAGGMAMMRHYWAVAAALRPDSARLDEAERFPLCQPEPLVTLWKQAGLTDVSVSEIVTPTVFRDFGDYWTPFLGGQGAAPTHLASLDAETQERIRVALQARLLPAPDGSVALTARAWAVQGRR